METLSLTWALGHVQSHTSGFQPKFSYLKWTTSWESVETVQHWDSTLCHSPWLLLYREPKGRKRGTEKKPNRRERKKKKKKRKSRSETVDAQTLCHGT